MSNQDRRAWLEEETQQKLNDRDKKGLPRLMRGTTVLGESTPTQPACTLRRRPRVTRRPRNLPSHQLRLHSLPLCLATYKSQYMY